MLSRTGSANLGHFRFVRTQSKSLLIWKLCVSVNCCLINDTLPSKVRQTVFVFEEQGCSRAHKLATRHNRDSISEKIRFIHVVSSQNYCSTLSVILNQIPRSSSSRWVHSTCWLIQNNNLRKKAMLSTVRNLAKFASILAKPLISWIIAMILPSNPFETSSTF